jgi:hypothetical protein
VFKFNHAVFSSKKNPGKSPHPMAIGVIGAIGAHCMMTKPKAPTCHIEISPRLMKYPLGIENLHFCTNLINSIIPSVVIGKSASG